MLVTVMSRPRDPRVNYYDWSESLSEPGTWAGSEPVKLNTWNQSHYSHSPQHMQSYSPQYQPCFSRYLVLIGIMSANVYLSVCKLFKWLFVLSYELFSGFFKACFSLETFWVHFDLSTNESKSAISRSTDDTVFYNTIQLYILCHMTKVTILHFLQKLENMGQSHAGEE